MTLLDIYNLLPEGYIVNIEANKKAKWLVMYVVRKATHRWVKIQITPEFLQHVEKRVLDTVLEEKIKNALNKLSDENYTGHKGQAQETDS